MRASLGSIECDHEAVWIGMRCSGGEGLLIGALYVAPDVTTAAFGLILVLIETVVISHNNHKVP